MLQLPINPASAVSLVLLTVTNSKWPFCIILLYGCWCLSVRFAEILRNLWKWAPIFSQFGNKLPFILAWICIIWIFVDLDSFLSDYLGLLKPFGWAIWNILNTGNCEKSLENTLNERPAAEHLQIARYCQKLPETCVKLRKVLSKTISSKAPAKLKINENYFYVSIASSPTHKK